MSNKGFVMKAVVGTVLAFALGKHMNRLMDENHEHVKGLLPDSFESRKHRMADKEGSTSFPSSQFFMNKDGLGIFYRSWVPAPVAEPMARAIVIICHGLGEHSGRYEKLGRKLAGKGFAVYALDHQGHGQSEGTRMYVKSFKDFLADVHQLTELAKKKHPLLEKVFILGHSMGGLIATYAAFDAPRLYQGAVLSAPPFKVNPLPSFLLDLIPKIASFLPKLPGPGLELETLCHDKAIVDRYFNDPLNNMGPQTLRITSELLENIMKVEKEVAPNFPIPYILMHGTADKLCIHEGATNFHAATKVEDKTFVSYDGAFHELFNEPDHEKNAMADALKWLDSRA